MDKDHWGGTSLRIAIAQMNTSAADFERTVDRMVEYSHRAAQSHVDLLVFPMAALTGPLPVGASDQEGYLLDLAETLVTLSDRLECPSVVPLVTSLEGELVPEAMLVRDGNMVPLKLGAYLRSIVTARKGEGPSVGQESPAPDLPVLEIAGARLGIAFTYDDLDDYDDFDFDVDVVLFLSGYSFGIDDPSSVLGSAISEGRFLGDAEATSAWIVASGSLGGYGTQVFTGSSFVLAPWGELAAQAPSLEESFLVCDIAPHSEGPLAHPLEQEVFDRPLSAWGALSLGLSDLCEKTGNNDVAVLLDGSLDSMVVAALATDALGPTRVHALVLDDGVAPHLLSSRTLVRNLRVDARELSAVSIDAGGDAELMRDLAEAHLAALAREVQGIALSNADKTALALDEGVRAVCAARVMPIGDLYRSDVIELARLRNTISPVISRAAQTAYEVPEVSGLEECGSSDEERLAFVDHVLMGYVEGERSVSDIVAERGHAHVVEEIVRRVSDLELSRSGRGVCLIASSRTLFDARNPLGLVWRDRLRGEDERSDPEGQGNVVLPDLAGLVRAGGGQPEHHIRDVREMIDFLRDFSQGGGLYPEGFGDAPGAEGQDGGEKEPGQGHVWSSPFSEN